MEKTIVVEKIDTLGGDRLQLWTENVLLIGCSISSLLSFFGSLAIIVIYTRELWNKTPSVRMDESKQMVYGLSWLDLTSAFGFLATVWTQNQTQTWCYLQASLLQFGSLGSILWNSCMAFSLYRWVILRTGTIPMLCFIAISYGIGLGTVFVMILGGLIANGGSLWCWVDDSTYQFMLFYGFLLLCWTFNAVVFVNVRREIHSRSYNMHTTNHINAQTSIASDIVVRKLMLYLLTFVVLWLPGLINRTVQIFHSDSFFIFRLLHVLLVPLNGFVNAVIYGGVLKEVESFVSCGKKNKQVSDAVDDDDNWAASPYSRFCSPTAHSVFCTQSHQSTQLVSYVGDPSLFVSTFNMGEGVVPSNLQDWIPFGHDLYAIGLQECMFLNETKQTILAYLNNTGREEKPITSPPSTLKQYEVHVVEIGSTNTNFGYHGHIAVLLYVPVRSGANGIFRLLNSVRQDVSNGVNLGVKRASNKGAVGFAFKYYDTTMAIVNCHLASDSQGKSRIKRRNADCRRIFRNLEMDGEVTGFDFHLMYHHVIFMGDLNYRMTRQENVQGMEILTELASVYRTHTKWVESETLLGQKYDTSARVSLSNKAAESNETNAWKECSVQISQEKKTVDESDNRIAHLARDSISRFDQMISAWKTFLQQHDELGMCMEEGRVFAFFKECDIRFPPTYRRVRRNIPFIQVKDFLIDLKGNSDSSEDLEMWCHASKSVKLFTLDRPRGGKRIPSYTDRVLYHSIEDRKERLSCELYNSCESINTSDHKPVNAVFRLQVDKRMSPVFEKIVADVYEYTIHLSDISYELVHQYFVPFTEKDLAPLPSCFYQQNNREEHFQDDQEVMHQRHSIDVPYNEPRDRMSSLFTPAELIQATRSAPQGNGFASRTRSAVTSSVGSSHRCDGNEGFSFRRSTLVSRSELDDTDVYCPTIATITAIFPLPSEDILAEQRKVYEVMSSMGEETPEMMRCDLLKFRNSNRVSMDKVFSSGMEVKGIATLIDQIHVGIRLETDSNQAVGQGVICLLVPERGATSWQNFSISLTLGSQYIGKMKGQALIGKKFCNVLAKPLLRQRSDPIATNNSAQ